MQSSTPGAGPSHLTFPAPPPIVVQEKPSASTNAPIIKKDRLYVGNLHPSVDEYTLLQIFTKYGKIARLDFLFHKAGPAKGKPRGYAFVEYSAKEDANKALVGLHDKLVRGRKLVVTFAHQMPASDSSAPHRRPGTDTTRPTALSILKTHRRQGTTSDKIAALEKKLKQMKSDAPGVKAPPSVIVPLDAGLPAKPPSSVRP